MISIYNDVLSRKVNLNEISFSTDNGNYFKIQGEGQEFIIDYTPSFEEEWDFSKYELFLFTNPYLGAENDIYQVYLQEHVDRAGWIFPISALESNENNFAYNKVFNGYRYVAYQLLLRYDKTFKTNVNNIKLTDIFDDNTIVCILSKDDINRSSNFNLADYLISFYSYGYFKLEENKPQPIQQNIWFRDIFEFRKERSRVTILKSGFDLSKSDYVLNIFSNHLLYNDNLIVRFILLYQVIEELMQIESDQQIRDIINRYSTGLILKNDFKAEINEISSEFKLISLIIEKSGIEASLITDFKNKTQVLYENLNYNPNGIADFSKLVYSFRNLFTHNYRLMMNEEEKTNHVVCLFEHIIIQLLLGYKFSPLDETKKTNDVEVVIEGEEKLDHSVDHKTKLKEAIPTEEIYKLEIPKIESPKVVGNIDLSKFDRGNRPK